ncbi:hypothetical protein LIER_03865 [Lithospermum erythrorhizon]|uniref:Uncharacterized protein n=1 Tax=Lithospermum erythrorhizon TaxID=34254 RepID=A0AAV3NUQ6_LITER
MNTDASNTANVLGGKTVRACDSCLLRRARWFCPADDAFLCQSCDNTVHSANQLASRHERVRIGISSSRDINVKGYDSAPAWHQGFTRKARTPRHGKQTIFNFRYLVPEIGSDETTQEDNEDQFQFRVPIFDPFDAKLCSMPKDVDNFWGTEGDDIIIGNELDTSFYYHDDFATGTESLLTVLNEDISTCDNDQDANVIDVCFETSKVKMEDNDEEVKNVIACHLDPALDMAPGESLNWDIDYEMGEHQQEHKIVVSQVSETPSNNQAGVNCKRKMHLILNYEAVITAWNNQGSPWADGVIPKLNPDNCWSDFLDACGGVHTYRDGGREAKVSRYKEKRRTRLFSRKIRYEVRKLNAEKRPRMKGRFVKRTNIGGASNLPT